MYRNPFRWGIKRNEIGCYFDADLLGYHEIFMEVNAAGVVLTPSPIEYQSAYNIMEPARSPIVPVAIGSI